MGDVLWGPATVPFAICYDCLQALQVLDSLVLPGTDQLDVKDKAAVSGG